MPFFTPRPLLPGACLSPQELKSDYSHCVSYGAVLLGDKALYFRGLAGGRYLPLTHLTRAFLRVHESSVSGEYGPEDSTFVAFVAEFNGREKEAFYSREHTAKALLEALRTKGIDVGKPGAGGPVRR